MENKKKHKYTKEDFADYIEQENKEFERTKERARMVWQHIDDLPEFRECESVEEANGVDMRVYRLVTYSDRRGVYIFCKRKRK